MNDIANKKFLFKPLLLLIICISNKPEIKNKIRALLDLPSKDRRGFGNGKPCIQFNVFKIEYVFFENSINSFFGKLRKITNHPISIEDNNNKKLVSFLIKKKINNNINDILIYTAISIYQKKLKLDKNPREKM